LAQRGGARGTCEGNSGTVHSGYVGTGGNANAYFDHADRADQHAHTRADCDVRSAYCDDTAYGDVRATNRDVRATNRDDTAYGNVRSAYCDDTAYGDAGTTHCDPDSSSGQRL
jgi:hypothetical protein